LLARSARARNHPRRHHTNDHDARAARQAPGAVCARYKVEKRPDTRAEERRKGFA
jgi:hypothetical protein